MRIIALMNQKGGVGKTTTTVNLGAALAEQGKKVCLADMDPQSHLTINYGLDPSPQLQSLYDVLAERCGFLEAARTVGENIAVIPGSIDLAAAEVELADYPHRQTLLKQRIEAAQGDFDYLLLDCPPSLGLLTINALAAANEVLVPMQPHFLALQGVGKLLETVQMVSRQINPQLRVTGIVLTLFDSQTRLCGEVVNDLTTFLAAGADKKLPWSGAKIFSTRIRRNIKLAESPSFGQTIFQYDAASHGAADYRALARELIELNAAAVKSAAPAAVQVTVNPAVASPSGIGIGGLIMQTPTLFAPWRMEYIRSLDKSDGCFLCAAANANDAGQRRDRLLLWATELSIVVINRYPYANGHLLVAPRAHKEEPAELTDAEQLDLSRQTIRAVQLLKRAVSAQGFNIGINLGRVAGAGLPGHVHQHVVPRWGGDTNFMSVVGETRVVPQAIAQLYDELIRVAAELG